MTSRAPLVEELVPAPAVPDALLALCDRPGVVLFDSALRRDELGRYSFLTAEPRQTFVLQRPAYGVDPFAPLRGALHDLRAPALNGLPPFQGGVAGLLSYELGACWERLDSPEVDDFEIPALCAGLYDWTLAWDHSQDRCWLIVQAFADRPAARLADLRAALEGARRRTAASAPAAAASEPALAIAAPQRPISAAGQLPELFSNFSRDDYLAAVRRVIESIRAGDVFQANLSQRLLCRAQAAPVELYRRLRDVNPAPFAAYFAHDDWALLSASPERFLRVSRGIVETRPIKGTRRRRSMPEADLFTRDELRESEKDLAENVMIVDLLRNDLSRVCRPGTIRVGQLYVVEMYQTVQHLVSEVRGELRPGGDLFDVLAAAFPGGSITGAPKVRAMQIIGELERLARGPYCGSLFYCGFDGSADSSILIRTLLQRRGWICCGVGGGIVAQSDAAAEYEETLDKAAGLLRALRPAG